VVERGEEEKRRRMAITSFLVGGEAGSQVKVVEGVQKGSEGVFLRLRRNAEARVHHFPKLANHPTELAKGPCSTLKLIQTLTCPISLLVCRRLLTFV
jgi:hypothetical protein